MSITRNRIPTALVVHRAIYGVIYVYVITSLRVRALGLSACKSVIAQAGVCNNEFISC